MLIKVWLRLIFLVLIPLSLCLDGKGMRKNDPIEPRASYRDDPDSFAEQKPALAIKREIDRITDEYASLSSSSSTSSSWYLAINLSRTGQTDRTLGLLARSIVALDSSIRSKIGSIDLSWNIIGDPGADFVASLIRHGVPNANVDNDLRSFLNDGSTRTSSDRVDEIGAGVIDLTGNAIGPDGARFVGEALRHDPPISAIIFAENALGTDGVFAFFEGEKGRDTMHRGMVENGDTINASKDKMVVSNDADVAAAVWMDLFESPTLASNNHLKKVSFARSNPKLNSTAATAISEAIFHRYGVLSEIDLSGNALDDISIEHIALAIAKMGRSHIRRDPIDEYGEPIVADEGHAHNQNTQDDDDDDDNDDENAFIDATGPSRILHGLRSINLCDNAVDSHRVHYAMSRAASVHPGIEGVLSKGGRDCNVEFVWGFGPHLEHEDSAIIWMEIIVFITVGILVVFAAMAWSAKFM